MNLYMQSNLVIKCKEILGTKKRFTFKCKLYVYSQYSKSSKSIPLYNREIRPCNDYVAYGNLVILAI